MEVLVAIGVLVETGCVAVAVDVGGRVPVGVALGVSVGIAVLVGVSLGIMVGGVVGVGVDVLGHVIATSVHATECFPSSPGNTLTVTNSPAQLAGIVTFVTFPAIDSRSSNEIDPLAESRLPWVPFLTEPLLVKLTTSPQVDATKEPI
jgi:hypothetical protein